MGNVINIDCNVFANPSKSVHYSWFFASASTDDSAAPAAANENNNNNLSALIMRDAALDEQIDESRLVFLRFVAPRRAYRTILINYLSF